jgi:predicted GNAT family N-acyltransferase
LPTLTSRVAKIVISKIVGKKKQSTQKITQKLTQTRLSNAQRNCPKTFKVLITSQVPGRVLKALFGQQNESCPLEIGQGSLQVDQG